jgi:hypothetical protein
MITYIGIITYKDGADIISSGTDVGMVKIDTESKAKEDHYKYGDVICYSVKKVKIDGSKITEIDY